jgi:hypothetical protein
MVEATEENIVISGNLFISRAGFLKLSYTYHQWYDSHCSVVNEISKKKSKVYKNKNSFYKCSYIENLIKLFFI